MTRDFGRHLLGIAAIGFGVITFVGHDASIAPMLLYATAVVSILGGLMMQWRRTLAIGASGVAVVMLISTLRTIPGIVAAPAIYNSWGNGFEQLSMLCGAIIVLANTDLGSPTLRTKVAQLAYLLFGICVVSFALEQAFYLKETAGLVPAWIPPNPTFWAVATTIAFIAAAFALLTRIYALLAAKLLTAMLLGFGLIVWLPTLFSGPPKLFAWSEMIETFGIAAVARIVATMLTGATHRSGT